MIWWKLFNSVDSNILSLVELWLAHEQHQSERSALRMTQVRASHTL